MRNAEENRKRNRPWEPEKPKSTEEGGDADGDGDTGAGGEKVKQRKQKYGLIFGYVGEGYHGLQMNEGDPHPTVEKVLIQAMHSAGLISDENMENVLQKVQWQRASRTDKGVHALRNLVTGKFGVPADGEAACVDRLNSFLPPDIRGFYLQPCTNSFNSYLFCSGRKYDYYLPTYALMNVDTYKDYFPPSVAPQWPVSDEVVVETAAAANSNEPQTDKSGEGANPVAPQPSDVRMYMFRTVPADLMTRLIQYRVPTDVLERARTLFRIYCGTHCFHNFTPHGKSSDASMHRYIRSIDVSDPFIFQGREWVKISLDGQSFMLNQIRKMIGCVCTVLACGETDSFLESCLRKDVKRGIPMAPANGLLLLALDFTRYNTGLQKMQEKGSPCNKAPMYLDDEHHSGEAVEDLRTKILSVIARKESEESIISLWMRSVRHTVRLAWDQSFVGEEKLDVPRNIKIDGAAPVEEEGEGDAEGGTDGG